MNRGNTVKLQILRMISHAMLFGSLGLCCEFADASQFSSVVLDSGAGAIHMDGDIETDDFKKFKEVYDRLKAKGIEPQLVILDSNGGNVGEGILIGTFLNVKKMATAVESGKNCFSSCISIYAAGSPRTAYPGARMGVHRANNNDEDNATARSVSIYLNDYYRKFNVPKDIRIAMIDTPPNEIYVLSESQLKQFSSDPKLRLTSSAPVDRQFKAVPVDDIKSYVSIMTHFNS